MYTIHDAHKQGVTAIATTSDSSRIVSGGGEGQVSYDFFLTTISISLISDLIS